MYLNSMQQALRSALLQQAEEAFSEKPDLAGVVHGRRRITQGARGKRTALFPSRKNDLTVALESQIEAVFCLLLERDPEVTGYRCQSLEIELGLGESYISDFLFQTRAGSWEVKEIKPSRAHLNDDTRVRLAKVNALLTQSGFGFSVGDLTDMPGPIELENLFALYQRSSIRPWSHQECDLALAQLHKLPPPRMLGAWYVHLHDAGLSPLLADHLLFHGLATANLERPLRLDMQVGVPA